ncbi:MAG: type II toxin-antitoxin system PemK/MazF family toxin [Propionibacteriaceae bacterium]|jgi:mRNA interferase MazF|nr:type II toxin-antitoxin system PemK/MazF family toxin [Propionibacteriaceae bacterium]
MRSIVKLKVGGKTRPALLLTRTVAQPYLNQWTLAPITSTIRGIATEVPLGPDNGLDHPCVANCDIIVTVPKESVGETIGLMFDEQETTLREAIAHAFDLSS